MVSKEEAKKHIIKVNDYWIAQNPDVGICAWEKASYFLGNMAAFKAVGKKEYLDYALKWADKNDWHFYNDGNLSTKDADSQLCADTYFDLLDINSDFGTDEYIAKSMRNTLNDGQNDYWWWVDAIYMALEVYCRMGIRYNDERYFDKAYKLFCNTAYERKCYDEKECLWFRDERFLYEVRKTDNGKKVFWSRGNGWVFAGIARTLRILPKTNKYYSEYLKIYHDMAEALEKCMCEDGFWRPSLYDRQEHDVPETSGTALFILGYLIGINDGFLDGKYLKTAEKGIDGLLNKAINEEGRVGLVQKVADYPGVPVRKEFTSDYAVGTVLLVLKEIIDM